MKGHVSFLCREDELLDMVDRLPRTSLDAAVLRREAPGGKVEINCACGGTKCLWPSSGSCIRLHIAAWSSTTTLLRSCLLTAISMWQQHTQYNGAMGYVVAVVYKDGYKRCGAGATAPGDQPVVVVNVPAFSGENPWFETQLDAHGAVVGVDRRKWVPIPPVERRCERGCCSRTGVPLATGKADSVHCCQGMSGGEGKTVRRIIGMWSADAEAKWPGILYVLASRVQDLADIAFAAPSSGAVGLAGDAFAKVGSSETWRKTHAEVGELVKKAKATRKRCDLRHREGRHGRHTFGSVEHWAALCSEVADRARGHLDSAMCAVDRGAVEAVLAAWSDE